jgi:hypothetical protein
MIQSDVVRVVECAAAAREQLPRRRRQAFTSVIGKTKMCLHLPERLFCDAEPLPPTQKLPC